MTPLRRALAIGALVWCVGGAVLPARLPAHARPQWQTVVRVSHYWDTGKPMATEIWPFYGAVACSDDIGLYATVETPDGEEWDCLDTGELNGWGYSRVDFYGFDAEARYGQWITVKVW